MSRSRFVRCVSGFALALSLVARSVSADEGVKTSPASDGSIVVDRATIDEQSAFYAPKCSSDVIANTCRSYKHLQAEQRRSFPDLLFFLYHPSDLKFPTYLPTCSTAGIDTPTGLVGRLNSAKTGNASELLNDVSVAAQDLQNLVYRLRGCDYAISVYAWNTRLHPHDAPFDFAWQVGCNSFAYESSADWLSKQDSEYRQLIGRLVTESIASAPPSPTAAGGTGASANQTFTTFVTEDYLRYTDLYERLSSCSASVEALAYPPNTKRILCNDAAFVGALLAGSAAVFGRRWTSGLQNSVSATGTVIIAYPALCGAAAGGGASSTGKISTSSGSSPPK